MQCTGTGSLLDSILSTLLKKQSSDIWVVSLSSLIIDDKVALVCILKGCCNLHVPFYICGLCLKTKIASSNEDNPLAISCIMNLFSSSVTFSSCCSTFSIIFTFVSIVIAWHFLQYQLHHCCFYACSQMPWA